MWRLCKLGYRHEPRLMLAAFVLSQLAALPDALLALWLMLLGKGVIEHSPGLVRVSAIGLGVSAAATWFLRTISTRVQRRFRDKVTALESHAARLQASVVTVAHHERPTTSIDSRCCATRSSCSITCPSVFATAGWVLRLAVTIALLMSIHPALALLGIFALPTVFTSTWRPAVERAAQEQGAQSQRLARHLFTTATTAPPGKEVRVTGIGERLIAQRRQAWERWYGSVAGPLDIRGVAHAGRSLRRRVRRLGGFRLVAKRVVRRRRPAGARGRAGVGGSSGATVGEIGFARLLDGRLASSRVARGLRGVAFGVGRRRSAGSAARRHPSRPPVVRLPWHVAAGARRCVADAAGGAVVAIVGENGAGKTTLVKLLAKMSSRRLAAYSWTAHRWRMPADGGAAACRGFKISSVSSFARQSVGLGDVIRIDDELAVVAAVGRAGADDVVAHLKAGLDTQLGATWPDGVDLSFGQWQKMALARGFMRDRPLLLVLDEPTAALDAETEHALFERYAASARDRDGRRDSITILVSHRFSTVRMADLIVVLDGSRLAEVGSHEELMARHGQYSELYNIQAAAYR
jgi:ATP-binding cassette subfamily B protein